MRILLSKSYGEKKVFENFALEVAQGEILCVLGASGAGKTTLLNALAGLISFEGEVTPAPKKVGYIFQEPRLIPGLTVEQNLLYVGGRVENIDEILRKTELLEHRNKRPRFLSGGEKQRVAFARAFVCENDLLLLDEPFSSLDTALKIRMMETFARLWEEKKQAAVLVTHDLEEAWALGHRIILLKEGKIVFDVRPTRETFPAKYGSGGEEKEALLKAALAL